MASRYKATLERLYKLEVQRGWDLKLESVREALSKLGSPELELEVIHIAGTNGKGSVAAFAHAVLSASGKRPGLYTSPHLEDFRERIRLGEQDIEAADVVRLTEESEQAAARAGVELTFFELATVMGFTAFAQAGVAPVVVEVGLGGRLDATNVVKPRVTVITTISLDHESYLGTDLASIAREKAGIIKPGRPVVVGRIDGEALATIEKIAAGQGAPLLRLGRDFSIIPDGDGFTYRGRRTIPMLHSQLAGAFQDDNAAVALAALEAGGWLDGVTDDAIRRGLLAVRWPGRLERVGRVLLDGAHNPAAARALVREGHCLAGGRPIHLVYGTLADKSWRETLGILIPLVEQVSLVPVRDRRGEDPERIGQVFPEAQVVESATVAVKDALVETEQTGGIVLVAGSLFLVGEIRAYLQKCSLATPEPSVLLNLR